MSKYKISFLYSVIFLLISKQVGVIIIKLPPQCLPIIYKARTKSQILPNKPPIAVVNITTVVMERQIESSILSCLSCLKEMANFLLIYIILLKVKNKSLLIINKQIITSFLYISKNWQDI